MTTTKEYCGSDKLIANRNVNISQALNQLSEADNFLWNKKSRGTTTLMKTKQFIQPDRLHSELTEEGV